MISSGLFRQVMKLMEGRLIDSQVYSVYSARFVRRMGSLLPFCRINWVG
jgi:hypothetical protein